MSNIKLFRSNETNFTHNEWVLNEIIITKPSEGLNNDFTMELEYPIEDTKGISSNLVIGAIISVPALDDREDQLFRIIDKETTSSTIIVQAQAKLLADLKENRIRAMTLTGLTREQAIQAVLNACLDPHSYSVGNRDTNTNTNVIVNAEEGNPLSAIIGDENSVLSEYGGEFIVDNNTIDIVDKRGEDNGVVIEHGKNLSSISEKTNNTDLATVLIPKSGAYRLPEYYIESPKIANYEKRYFKDVEFNLDIWDGESERGEDQITLEEAYTIMRTTCNSMFTNDKVDQITFNYTVDFIELSKTEEYKNYAILETVNVGDTVYIKHKILNVDLEGRVNNISYTVDSEGITIIDTVEIGFNRKEITDIIKETVKSIKFAKDEINLQITNTAKHITAAFTIADDTIKQSVVDLDNELSAELTVQATKINAVVEEDSTGMGFELSKNAFKVACVGSSGASVTINEYGLTVEDGKFKLKNNGSTVFYVNTSGKCTADGGFVVDDGDSACKIGSTGISITNDNGYTGTLYVDPGSTTLSTDDDLEVWGTMRAQGTLRAYSYTHCYDDLDVDLDLYVDGDLDVSGTKNCLQSTENYGSRRINAYETAEYYFGDIGEGVIKDGECIVYIDDIFSECVNTSINYQVEIFEYKNRGSIIEVERYPDYFIVKGNVENIEFGWELKAKRLGYENNRLEKVIKLSSDNTNLDAILLENNSTNLVNILLETSNDTSLEDILLEEVA